MFGFSEKNSRSPQQRHFVVQEHSKCFSTTSHGFIPLINDVQVILGELTSLGHFVVQLFHEDADMAVVLSGDELKAACQADEPDSVFCFDSALPSIAFAHAQLSICDCCGSPGYIDFFNSDCVRILKIAIMPDVDLADWGRVLSRISTDPNCTLSAVKRDNLHASRFSLPTDAEFFRMLPCGFLKLLVDYGNLGQSLEFTFHSGEFCLRKAIVVAKIEEQENCTQCMGTDGGFSFDSKRVLRFARYQKSDREYEYLALLGPDDSEILEVSLPSDSSYGLTWSSALDQICQQYCTK